RSRLNCGELADTGGCSGISGDPDTRQARRNLLKQFEPFRANFVFENRETGHVAAGLRLARNKAGTDWIGNLREYDRQCSRRLLHWTPSRGAAEEGAARSKG